MITLTPQRHAAGCMVCGAPLIYYSPPRELTCAFCGRTASADAACEAGHFVCDGCHLADGAAAIERICRSTDEQDMLALLRLIRAHPSIPMHGPEHHAMVPAIIVTTYRNLGGQAPEGTLKAVINRGFKIPGGFCGFAGNCGAAVGVGIAFAALLGSSPIKAELRQTSINVTQAVLAELGRRTAARCCQRDSWLSLVKAAELSAELLPVQLKAEGRWTCEQHQRNKQCLGEERCPLRES